MILYLIVTKTNRRKEMSLVINIYPKHFKDFKKGYGEAVKFTEYLEEYHFSEEGMQKLRDDCAEFFTKNYRAIVEACRGEDYNYGHAGADYWYTRNGHGVGYWDRGLDGAGEELTKACENTTIHAYKGDDNKIYIG
jgi:hypothetical protein